MKKITIFNIALWLISQQAIAQGGLILDDVRMTCLGTIKIVIDNGRWKSNLSTFDRGNSTVKFTGNASAANSVIEGNVTTFQDLQIAKSLNNVRIVSSSVNVTGNLIFTSNNLDLNGKTFVLGTGFTAGNLSGETENSRTFGAQPLSSVIKTRSISNPANFHFGGMGIRMTATGNFGNTTVDRRHNAQTLPTGDGILKYWRVSTTNNPAGQNATLRFNYFDANLNGLTEADLHIWRSVDNGVIWTDMGRSSNSTTQNYVEQIVLTDINGWWTLGAPTPFNEPGTDRNDIVSELPIQPDWHIYPNPAVDHATISIPSQNTETVTIELFDTKGKAVLRQVQDLQIGANQFELSIQALPSGIYFVQVAGRPFRPISMVKSAKP
ncbi:MAG: T9SS type A sorting domain-containing protein [Saprospiraceae bacterium]